MKSKFFWGLGMCGEHDNSKVSPARSTALRGVSLIRIPQRATA